MPPCDVAVFLSNVVKLMNELLRRFPSSYADLPVSDLYCGTRMLSDTGQLTDEALVTEVDELMKLRSEKAMKLKRKEEEELRQQRMKPRRNAGANDDVNPPENFRYLSIVPTQADILSGERPFLRRNKIDGSYDDAEHYLDVQFRLLREDFMRPLREGIAKFLERIGSSKIGALQDIRVYKDVRLLYPVCTSNGLRYKIKFDNTKLRHIRWENSKRLIFGSLMCLSKDNFDSFVFATVANRELLEIQRGTVDIQFIQLSDNVRLEEGDVYQMVESTVYFEAYRHVLEGLKKVKPEELPLQNYIVNCEKEVEPPAYLRNRSQEQVTFDLTPIMKKTSSVPDTTASCWLQLARLRVRNNVRKGANVSLLNLASWPSAEDLGLDDSQFRALHMALTKEFAVIQGPPGTGKTYIGLKIANVLLHNKLKWDTGARPGILTNGRRVLGGRPILVVCYTNHALDQFLEGIHQFHPKGIVRVGGRSQSEAMKECGLSEIKHKMRKDKKVPQYIRQALYEAHKAMEHTTNTLQTAAEGLKKCLENVLHEDGLYNRASSMTAAHYESLKQPFVERVEKKESAMLHWLQLSMNSANASQEGGANAEAEVEIEEADKEEGADDNENPDVLYEANVMQDQRILDDDDVIVYSSNAMERSEELEVVKPFVFNEDGWQIQNAHRLRKKFKRIMILELSKKDVMPDERAETVTNVWNLSLEDRWRLYRRWLIDVRERYRRDISYLQYGFEAGVRRLKETKGKLDLEILERADVVGMTTTGAAKHRELLGKLQPRITIVEEAAEVLESHIVTSLTPACQHLILIGDHQQLRPNPTVYDLAKHYNLDVSLFERMVKNGMPFTRLRLQHRMRPEISKMLDHIYFEPKLENHESVMNFGSIKGVARNAFFVDHEETEVGTTKENVIFIKRQWILPWKEKAGQMNTEAKFMAALCRYFILQGYEREQITVLTAYTGQLIQLKNEMPKDFFRGVSSLRSG
ncbi:NFX1-type zinc finger-containing protein 1 [Desmophyllum pertusum]|uniref:NFX1-type zinc finger-containing protein 1 n=1 Tax=Desmophyllum pertusum TaxID=174260 RepID=A0A9W9YFL8_9CNID|nr:NFX1-type zinc finger-containing protein 1 [Desmophyllum pertusum]